MKGSIALSTLRTSMALGVRLAVQAGTLLLIARILGPDRFGAFAGMASLAVLLGTLSTFGTHLILLKEMSVEPARREQVLPYAIPSSLLCGSILLTVYLLICTLALQKTSVPMNVLISIGTAEMLLNPLFGLSAIEHLALERTARSQLLMTLPLALRLLAAVTVFLLQPADPLAAFSYGYLAASLISLSVANTAMSKPWPSLQKWRLPSKVERHEAAGYAVLAITAAGPSELDKTLATKLLPLASSGIYAAGARVIGALTLPVIAMMLSALPRLFREHQNQPERTALLVRCLLTATLAYSTVLAIVLWFTAPVFVQLFGANYDGIQQMIQWLCFAVPGMALRIAVGSVLMALGKPWMRAGFEVAGLVVLGIGSVVFTSHLDALGMPFALACSEWGMAAIGMALIAKAKKNRACAAQQQGVL